MARLSLLVLICLLVAESYCQGPMPIEPTHSKHSVPSPTTTTTKAPTTTITPNTTTTPINPNSTTTITPSTTTTSRPNSTTLSTTTPTTPITTPATPITKPTTTPITTTTVKPTPMPDPGTPDWGNWTVLYKNSTKACIVLDIAVQFEIIETGSNKSIKINLPKNASASGTCDNNVQWLNLTWGANNSLGFDFSKTNNNTNFELENVTATLPITTDKGPQVYKLVHKKSEFSTPLSNSYKCARLQSLNLTELTSNETAAYFHMSHAQFQAFGNVTGHKFDAAMDCEGSSTPDVVPIVVGCVLAVLVVMVLIAYLIGRRRCQARGYLSM